MALGLGLSFGPGIEVCPPNKAILQAWRPWKYAAYRRQQYHILACALVIFSHRFHDCLTNQEFSDIALKALDLEFGRPRVVSLAIRYIVCR
jgi:hypothetical protein